MENMNDAADRILDSPEGNSKPSVGSPIAELDSNARIAELTSELEAARLETMVMEQKLKNARASLRVAETSLDEYTFADALTEFMAIMQTNMDSWNFIMGPVLVTGLKDLHRLLSGTSTKILRLMMDAIVKNVKSGNNEQEISYKRGEAWPMGVERLPFKKLSKRKQVALVAWLYISPDHSLLEVTEVHLQQDCLRDKFRMRLLHCVNSIRKSFDSDGWY